MSLCNVTVEIPTECGDIRPLDPARMRLLAVNGIQLLDRIDPNVEFISELASAGCITWPQRDLIMDTAWRRDRNNKLLNFLTRRSVADFQNFTKVLAKEQHFLVPLLVTDGGQIFLCAIAECFARLSHGMGVCLSIRPSVRPTHCCIESLGCKLGSRNLHCRLPQGL